MNPTVKLILLALIGATLAGCADNGAHTTASQERIPATYGVQGRDLGRGGATSGNVSSLDPNGNSLDQSVARPTQF